MSILKLYRLNLIIAFLSFTTSCAQVKVESNSTSDSNKIVLGYYSVRSFNNLKPSELPYSDLTHIVHFGVKPNADGSLSYENKNGNDFFDVVPELHNRAHEKSVKVIAGVKPEAAVFSKMVADPIARTKFIKELTELCISYNYDGVDIDWEQPSSMEDKINLVLLIKDLNHVWNLQNLSLMLSFAVPQATNLKFWDAVGLEPYTSFFGVMTYGMHGPWVKHSGHNSSTFSDPIDPDNKSVETAMGIWMNKGVPREKLLVGLAFYGFKYTGTDKLYTPYTKSVGVGYQSILDEKEDFKYNWDDIAKVPYLTKSTDLKEMIVYDDENSIREKCKYVNNNNFGGVIIWELNLGYIKNDSNKHPLMAPISEVFVQK